MLHGSFGSSGLPKSHLKETSTESSSHLARSLERFHSKLQDDEALLKDFLALSPEDRASRLVKQRIEEAEAYRIDILKGIPAFSTLNNDQLRTAADSLEEEFYKKGDRIIVQDEVGDTFYILQEGNVSVTRKASHDGREIVKELATLGKNAHFGDVSLLTEERRSATITVTSSEAHVLVMTKAVFDFVRSSTDKVIEANQRMIAQVVIDSMPMFQKFPSHHRKSIVAAMTYIHYQPNSYICRQGLPGGTFYVIVEGTCKATVGTPEREAHRYFTGDYFEELAILDQAHVRPTNIISMNSVSCYALSRNDFNVLMKTHEPGVQNKLLESYNKQKSKAKKPMITEQKHREGQRRITCFDEHNVKNNETASKYLKRACTFMAESLWISQYWRYFRHMVIYPNTVAEYGPVAQEIMRRCTDRHSAVTHIMEHTKHILIQRPEHRTHWELSFLIGLLKQRNGMINKFCKDWTHEQFVLLAKKLRLHMVLPLMKICEAGVKAQSAFIILKGSARVYSPVINEGRLLTY